MSYGTYHIPHLTCHNLFNDFFIIFLDKLVELVGRGLVSTGYTKLIFLFASKKVYPVIARAVLKTPVLLTDPVYLGLFYKHFCNSLELTDQ